MVVQQALSDRVSSYVRANKHSDGRRSSINIRRATVGIGTEGAPDQGVGGGGIKGALNLRKTKPLGSL